MADAPNWDDLEPIAGPAQQDNSAPNWDDLEPIAGPPKQAAAPKWEDLEPISKEEPRKEESRRETPPAEEEPSTLGTAARGVARAAAPTTAGLLGGMAGFEVGAGIGGAIGSVVPGIGTAIGAGIGGVGGLLLGGGAAAGVTREAQDTITDKLGLDSPESRERDIKAHPYVTTAAEIAPAIATLSPGNLSTKLATRLASGGIMGVTDVINQGVTKGITNIDPTQTAIAAAGGAALAGEARPWARGVLGKAFPEKTFGPVQAEAKAAAEPEVVQPAGNGVTRGEGLAGDPTIQAAVGGGKAPSPGIDVNEGPGANLPGAAEMRQNAQGYRILDENERQERLYQRRKLAGQVAEAEGPTQYGPKLDQEFPTRQAEPANPRELYAPRNEFAANDNAPERNAEGVAPIRELSPDIRPGKEVREPGMGGAGDPAMMQRYGERTRLKTPERLQQWREKNPENYPALPGVGEAAAPEAAAPPEARPPSPSPQAPAGPDRVRVVNALIRQAEQMGVQVPMEEINRRADRILAEQANQPPPRAPMPAGNANEIPEFLRRTPAETPKIETKSENFGGRGVAGQNENEIALQQPRRVMGAESRLHVGEQQRGGARQNWDVGQKVSVGFQKNLEVVAKNDDGTFTLKGPNGQYYNSKPHEGIVKIATPAENAEIGAMKTEKTEAGQQGVLPGAERISDAELAQRRADQPLRPGQEQKRADQGLFGDNTPQGEMFKSPKLRKSAPKPFEGMIENAEQYKQNAKDRVEKGQGTQRLTTTAEEEARQGRTVAQANEEYNQHAKTFDEALRQAGIGKDEVGPEVRDKAVQRVMRGEDPMEALDAATADVERAAKVDAETPDLAERAKEALGQKPRGVGAEAADFREEPAQYADNPKGKRLAVVGRLLENLRSNPLSKFFSPQSAAGNKHAGESIEDAFRHWGGNTDEQAHIVKTKLDKLETDAMQATPEERWEAVRALSNENGLPEGHTLKTMEKVLEPVNKAVERMSKDIDPVDWQEYLGRHGEYSGLWDRSPENLQKLRDFYEFARGEYKAPTIGDAIKAGIKLKEKAQADIEGDIRDPAEQIRGKRDIFDQDPANLKKLDKFLKDREPKDPTIGNTLDFGVQLNKHLLGKDGAPNPAKVWALEMNNRLNFVSVQGVLKQGLADGTLRLKPLPGDIRVRDQTMNGRALYAEPDLAYVYNNGWGRGLYGTAVEPIYDTLLRAKSLQTQAELFGGGFHFITIGKEVYILHAKTAIEQMASGDKEGAMRTLKTMPNAMGNALRQGKIAQELYEKPVDLRTFQGPLRPADIVNHAINQGLTNAGQRFLPTARTTPEYQATRGIQDSLAESFKKGSDSFKEAWQSGKGLENIKREAGEAGERLKQNVKAGKIGAAAGEMADDVSRIMQGVMHPLFSWYIPLAKFGAMREQGLAYTMARLKKEGFDLNDPGLRQKMADMVEDQGFKDHMKKVVKSTDDLLGELNNKYIFWGPVLKQSMLLGMRAFTWFYGTARTIGGGSMSIAKAPFEAYARGENATGIAKSPLTKMQYGEHYDPRVTYTAVAFPLIVAASNAIYQLFKTGELPKSPRDLVGPRTGGQAGKSGFPERAVLPGYEKDVYGWLSNPKGEAFNKLAGLPRSAIEGVFTNKDWKDDPIHDVNAPITTQFMQVMSHIMSSFLPISEQEATKKARTGTNLTTGERMVGIRQAPHAIEQPGRSTYEENKAKRAWERKLKNDERLYGK